MEREETLPLYHIDGTENLADMITKPRKLLFSELISTSKWMAGLEWMCQPTADLPRSQFLTLEDSAEEQLVSGEVFPDVESYTLQVEAPEYLEAHGADITTTEWSFPRLSDPPGVPPPPKPPGHPEHCDGGVPLRPHQ